jgi:hypothetical protein
MIVRLVSDDYFTMLSSFRLLNMLKEFQSCFTILGLMAMYSRLSKSLSKLLGYAGLHKDAKRLSRDVSIKGYKARYYFVQQLFFEQEFLHFGGDAFF